MVTQPNESQDKWSAALAAPNHIIGARFAAFVLLALHVSAVQAQGSDPAIDVQDSETQQQIDAAVQAIYPSLVRIHVVMEEPTNGRMKKIGGTGSGTIIHPEGYVLTNHHVAGNSTRVWCRLSNKLRVDAELIGTDPQTDLCLLKLNLDQIPDAMKPLPVARFGEFDSLEVGDKVLAMGSPAGVSQSVTLGVVANLEMIIRGILVDWIKMVKKSAI